MKVLLISYYYPPYNYGGGQRIFLLNKFLKEHSIDSYILTSFQTNEKNAIIIKDTNFTKTIKQKKYSLRKYNPLPDGMFLWSYRVMRFIKYNHKKFDRIIISIPPYSVALFSIFLHKKIREKIIIDIRDSWASSVLQQYANIVYEKWDNFLEGITYKKLNNIVCINSVIADKIVHKYKIKPYIIPNCLNKENIKENSEVKEKIIFYAGKMDYIRYNKEFFIAWNNIAKNNNLIFYFVGESIKQNIENIKEFGILERDKTLQLLNNASVGLILINFSIKNARETFTSKIFDYILMKKKILYVGPKTLASDFIIKNNLGISITSNNIKEIEKGIIEIFNKNIKVNGQLINSMDYRNIYSKYLELLRTANLNKGGP